MPNNSQDERESRARKLVKSIEWRAILIELMAQFKAETGLALHVQESQSYNNIENKLIETIEKTYFQKEIKPDKQLAPSGAKVGGHLCYLLVAFCPIKLMDPSKIKHKNIPDYVRAINVKIACTLLQMICQHTYCEGLAKLNLISDDDLVLGLDEVTYRDIRYFLFARLINGHAMTMLVTTYLEGRFPGARPDPSETW